MKQLILTVGCTGSGKSEWAANQEGFVIINRNDLRKEYLTGEITHCDKEQEEFITLIAKEKYVEAVRKGLDVIISDTNLMVKHREQWRHLAAIYGYKYSERLFHISLEDALWHNSLKSEPVPESVIRSQHDRFTAIVRYRYEKDLAHHYGKHN